MADGTPGTGRDGGELELITALGAAMLHAPWQDGLIVCDPDWRLLLCTPAAAVLLGLPASPCGACLWDLQPRLSGGQAELRYRSAMAAREAVEFVVPAHQKADGWVEVRALPLPQGVAFLLRDVTEREQTERRLRRMNANLRLAHAAARAASWSWLRGRAVRWIDPDAARKLIGLPDDWSREQTVEEWLKLVSPQDVPAFQRGVTELIEIGETTFQVQVAGADGAPRWLEIRGQAVERDVAGELVRVLGVTLDVTERVEAEKALRAEISEREKAESHQRLLINELNHRVKNTLASVQSIARQTLRRGSDATALELFDARLQALAWTHDVLTQERWSGASLQEVVRRILAPHGGDEAERFQIRGPEVRLSPAMALALAMGLHELATNAVKYGALSAPKGRVKVAWRVEAQAGRRPELLLAWRETGGPRVSPPARRGFGSRLIERGLAAELRGGAQMTFAPAGLRCEIRAPLD